MNTLTLQRNVQFLYEEQLARIESGALGCEGWNRDDDNPWKIRLSANGVTAEVIKRSAYAGELDGQQADYAQLIRPRYQGGEFNRTRSVNQYLTHWIYPYQGKFHPQMVRALLNIAGVGKGSLVLDPYVGSGTTALEASLLGVDCLGVDLSPLCALLTRVKIQSVEVVDEIRDRVQFLLKEPSLDPADIDSFGQESIQCIEFIRIARMVSLSDMARRGKDGRISFRKNLQAMLNSVETHARALQQFEITPGKCSISQGDTRDLGKAGVKDSSIDAVVTSPPYSIALDYIKNDEHALKALGVDIEHLRSEMTGVRGQGPKEKLALYNRDMRRMFDEVTRVLKPRAKAIFVIGNATVDRSEYTTTEQISEWAVEAGLEREREIPKIVFGLYNIMKDEKILIFRKPR